MTGGTLEATGSNSRAIVNAGGSALTITGGVVKAAGPMSCAILSYSKDARIIIGGSAVVTSTNTSNRRGTILVDSLHSPAEVVLELQGGTVSNTADPEGNSVCFVSGEVTAENLSQYYNVAASATVGKIVVVPPLPEEEDVPSSSGGSSKSSWVPTVTANVIDASEGSMGLGTYNNYDTLLVAGLEKLVAQNKGKTVNFDMLENGKVLYRVKLDPAKLAGVLKNDLSLSAHIGQNDAAVVAVKNRFAKYYGNEMVVITYGQAKPLGVNAEFCAKLDLSKLNTKTLYFYSYDNTTNTYTRIVYPGYFVDANGYSHITAPLGGSILITDAPLKSK